MSSATYTRRPRSGSPRPPPSSFYLSVRKNAAFSMADSPNPSFYHLPRSASTHSFRAPFLSPASRPGSPLWSPPSRSSLALPLNLKSSRPPLPSTRLPQKLSRQEKPWLSTRDSGARYSWWITFLSICIGLAGAAALCYLGATEAHKLTPDQLCSVLDDSFNSPDGALDTNSWTPEIQLGLSSSIGNGIPSEFSMTTADPANLHLTNNQLYITPTFTTDQNSDLDLFHGNYTLPGCTAMPVDKNSSSALCTVNANPLLGTVINPVQSARITTRGKVQLRYGRVEIRARLPRGDWLWPSVTLHPVFPAYNPAFPASGLITLLASRGNAPATYTYSPSSSSFVNHTSSTKAKPKYKPNQFGASNSITSTLAYAPLLSLFHQITGSFTLKKSLFTSDFHTYVLEWDEKWMRFYVDSRLTSTLDIDVGSQAKSFWTKGGFPLTARNDSAHGLVANPEKMMVVVDNPYEGQGPNAPFDQPFYVSIQLAAGGTDGWFPDEVGGKPWFDDAQTAMRDFVRAQDQWKKTWPDSVDDRSFRIDYVKIWEKCR